MNDRDDIETILDRFRQWLNAARAQVDGQGSDQEIGDEGMVYSHGDLEREEPFREFGIIDIVEEFTALRQEVKLQTKSGRGLFEQTEATLAALRGAIEQFRSIEPKEDQAVWMAGKALVEALGDLDEALERGFREIERARHQIADESVRALEKALNELHAERSWIHRRFLRAYHTQVLEVVNLDGQSRHEFFASFLEGFGLIQKRLRRVMAAERVERIVCENTLVDPALMTVLEVVERVDQPPGTVVKELRPGYTWRGRVVRYAEVQAVRGSPAESMHTAEVAPPAMAGDEIDNDRINDGFASR
jgi:molecular chaperone GrpE